MKILFFWYTFAPNIGGIESVSAILAERFAEAGHEVLLITQTSGEENAELRKLSRAGSPTPKARHGTSPSDRRTFASRQSNAQHRIWIERRPSLPKLLQLLSWCDVVFQNNISLRSLISALLMRKRVIVVHQTWLRNRRGGIGWNNRIKRALLRFVTNIAISEAMRDDLCSATASVARAGDAPALQFQMRVINNPYDDSVFRLHPEIARDKKLVFVGRFVSDKGADVLLRALKLLHDQGASPDLTMIGAGPEEQELRRLAGDLGLDGQVTFGGEKSGEELAAILNRHQIMVVPSRWAEPFGIVALEGIACGCVVVGSRNGGLGEAIGPCGLTFRNGDECELADCLKTLLLDPARRAVLQKNASAHLEKFRADAVAAAYLALIEEIQ